MKECLFVDGLLGDVITSIKECLFVDGLSCKSLMCGIMSCFPLGLCSRVILRGKLGYFPLEILLLGVPSVISGIFPPEAKRNAPAYPKERAKKKSQLHL